MGLVEALDEVPGVRIAFEPKPYEPRGHILFGTTVEGVMMCNQIESKLTASENRKLLDQGHKLACMNPEIGPRADGGMRTWRTRSVGR